MVDISVVFICLGMFFIGLTAGVMIVNEFQVKPLNRNMRKLKDTLMGFNKKALDNFNKPFDIKIPPTPFPEIHVKELDKEEAEKLFSMIFGKNSFKNEEIDEYGKTKQFYIDELTKMNAKGWSEKDSIEDLRKLYELLE